MFQFSGYAAIFNVRDAGNDVILPGSFSRTLAARAEHKSSDGGRIPLYWMHLPDQRIGWINEATEDDRGLYVRAEISNPQGGAATALRAGEVTGLSFGYRTKAATMDADGRTLRELDLFEVSLVPYPMQPGARVTTMEEV